MVKQHSGFKKQAIFYGPSHLILAAAIWLHITPIINSINKSETKKLLNGFKVIYQDAKLKDYEQVAKRALVWHGTGRYEKDADGNKVDIFSLILEQRELKPFIDIYDIFNGEMKSISTTPSRVLARCYADIHNSDLVHAQRYGNGFFWITYFYSKIYAEVFFRHGFKFLLKYPKWLKTASEHGVIKWGKKVNKDASLWNTFKLGSDIISNYPILIGIKSYDNALKTSKFMARAEVRLGGGLSLNNISHIEVPEEKIGETKTLLQKHNLNTEVFAIELGEYAASKQPFSKLLYP